MLYFRGPQNATALSLWLWVSIWALTSLDSASHSKVNTMPTWGPRLHVQHCDQSPLVCGPYVKAPSPSGLPQAATGPGVTCKHLLGPPCLATVPRAMWLGPRRYKGLTKQEQACPQLAENTGPTAGDREPATLYDKKQRCPAALRRGGQGGHAQGPDPNRSPQTAMKHASCLPHACQRAMVYRTDQKSQADLP